MRLDAHGHLERNQLLEALDQFGIVSVADRAGRIVAVNDPFCALSKYSREELLGRNHRIVNSGTHDAAFWRDMWATISAGSAWRGEICNRARDGSLYWVQSIIVPFRDAEGRIERYVSVRFDITALKTGEQALRRSEEMLARTGRVARVGGWELDLASRALQWTDETRRLHGVAPGHQPTIEEAIGFYAPEARAQIRALIARGMDEREPWDVELPFVRADGTPMQVRALGEVEFEGEQPVRLVGAFQDVTAQHEAREALRHQQAVTQSMLAAAPVAVRVARLRDNRVRLVNERFCRLVQRSPEECMELDVAPFYADPAAFDAIRRRLAAGETVHDELVELQLPERPEVPHTWALASYMLTDYEGEPAVLAWLYDVTELEQARESARRAKELLLQALEATQTGLAIYGSDDRLEMCNRRFLEMYAAAQAALLPGTHFADTARAIARHYRPADASAEHEDWLARRLDTFRQGGEQVRSLADGRHVRAVERELSDRRFVTLRTDVTELVEARRAAEGASEAKSAFLANASHEIRTPLNAILGLSYLLERETLPPEAHEHASRIAIAGRTLLGLVNNVLDLSKIEAGQFELEEQAFELRAVARGEMPLLAAGAPHKRLHTSVRVAADVPTQVRGDVTRLRQVLNNLLGNALKFTERGTVSLDVRRAAQAPFIVFEVRDTGIGIDAATRERLFQPYRQGDAGTARRYGGTGLGLSITARLVELMGGRIALDSVPGRGSTFTVTLPLPEDADAALDRPQAAPLRVLLAATDPGRTERLAALAQSLGWTCEAIGDGAALVAALDSGAPVDVLVIDGPALAARLGAPGPLPAAPWPATVVLGAPGDDGRPALPLSGSTLFDAVNRCLAAMPEYSARLLDATLSHGDRLQWLHGLRLLVVDDSSLNLDVARKILELEGASVLTCTGGEPALRLLCEERTPFDAVLLDVQMPDLDGLSVVRRLRGMPAFETLPVIALSAGVLKQDRDNALRAGMTDFLQKPLEPKGLVACLRRHVERHRDATLPVVQRPGTGVRPSPRGTLRIRGIDEHAISAALLGDRPLLLSLIRRLVTDLQSLAATPAADLPARLHRLRGSAQVLGASALAEAARRLEIALREGSGADAGKLARAMDHEVAALIDASRQSLLDEERRLATLHEQEAAQAAAGAPPLDARDLAELRALIESQSTRAGACVERLSMPLGSRLGPVRLARLRSALAEFDFAGALAELDGGLAPGGEPAARIQTGSLRL